MNLLAGLRLLAGDNILASAPGYRYFYAQVNADIWPGLFLFITGVVMFYGLTSDRLHKLNDFAIWFSLLFWAWFAIDIARANFSQIGSVAYLVLAVMYGYAYYHSLMWRAQVRRNRADQ
jgi:hypothetical protein